MKRKGKGISAAGWFAGLSTAGRLPVAGEVPVTPDRDAPGKLYPWQQNLLDAMAAGHRLTFNLPRRHGLTFGTGSKVGDDGRGIGRRTPAPTVQFIIDDPWADNLLGRGKLDATSRAVAQWWESFRQDADALERWADDGGPVPPDPGFRFPNHAVIPRKPAYFDGGRA